MAGVNCKKCFYTGLVTIVFGIGLICFSSGCNQVPGNSCGLAAREEVSAIVTAHDLAQSDDDTLWHGGIELRYLDSGQNQTCWLQLMSRNPYSTIVAEDLDHYPLGNVVTVYRVQYDSQCYFKADLNKATRKSLPLILSGAVLIVTALVVGHPIYLSYPLHLTPFEQVRRVEAMTKQAIIGAFWLGVLAALMWSVRVGCKLMPRHCTAIYSTSPEQALVVGHKVIQEPCYTDWYSSDCFKGRLEMEYEDEQGNQQSCALTVIRANPAQSNVNWVLDQYPLGQWYNVRRIVGEEGICYFGLMKRINAAWMILLTPMLYLFAITIIYGVRVVRWFGFCRHDQPIAPTGQPGQPAVAYELVASSEPP